MSGLASKELDEKARRLLEAAYDYWKQAQKEGIGGGIVWLDDADGHTVIFTRGEYRSHLLSGIDHNHHRERKHFHHLQDGEIDDSQNMKLR